MMRRNLLFLVVILLCSVSTRAQYRASIQGVVTDPEGAVVSGAALTLKNLDTNLQLTATSDENGVYNFNALPPAKFSLTVEKAGFKKKFLQNVGVIAEQSNALNIQLELGQVTESVTVSGDATPLIEELRGFRGENAVDASLPECSKNRFHTCWIRHFGYVDGQSKCFRRVTQTLKSISPSNLRVRQNA